MSDLISLSAVALARGVRERRWSPVRVVDACIARIRAAEPELGGLVETRFAQAREEAAAASRRSAEAHAPLMGVPILAPVSWASSVELRRVREAGAIWLGGPRGDCGAAALVALGGAPCGLDVRATFCGIVAHRSDEPHAVGLSARTVGDVTLLAAVVAGQIPPDAAAPDADLLRGTSVHVVVPPRLAPEARAAVHKAALSLREHGATLGDCGPLRGVALRLEPAPPCGSGTTLQAGAITVVRTDTDRTGRPLGVQIAATRAGGPATLLAAKLLEASFGSSSPVSARWV
ncbi:MAG: hypothetical protein KTR31_26870 [Myxococcales bacterium]|nr:hypothetical protein [Myxococcales bacterium]